MPRDLTPPDDPAHRLARAVALFAKGVIVVVAAAGLALFVAAPLLVGMSWPPGATELVSVRQALPAPPAGARAPEMTAPRMAGR